MFWSSKDMKTGALIFALGFVFGAFCFSNGASLEGMRSSRESWKSRHDTVQTELYTLRSTCKSQKEQQKMQHDSLLKMKQTELDFAQKALKDIEAVRQEEIEKLDSQLGFLKERSEEMQKQNSECTVMQQTSIHSIETSTEKNRELLTSLLNILSTAANADESQVADEAALELDIIPELEEEFGAEPGIVDDEPPIDEVDDEAQAGVNDVQVGFDPPPIQVANAQDHEKEFHQQIHDQQQNEELQMDHPDEYPGENVDEVQGDDANEGETLEYDFNLDNELAGMHHGHADDHVEHIPDVQEHPIDPEKEIQAEAEFAPPMPKAKDEILAVDNDGIALNRLLEIEDKPSKPKKKKRKRKKKKASSGV